MRKYETKVQIGSVSNLLQDVLRQQFHINIEAYENVYVTKVKDQKVLVTPKNSDFLFPGQYPTKDDNNEDVLVLSWSIDAITVFEAAVVMAKLEE